MATPNEYAEELQQALEDAIAFAESCTAAEWATLVPGEEWPVAVVLHHVGLGTDLVSGWIDCALEGRAVEQTGEEIDEDNLRHAEEFAGVGLAETVGLLRTSGSAMVAKIGGLGETDLERTAPFAPAGGKPFSVGQFCPAAAGHLRSHVAHAKEAVGRGV